MKLIELIKGLWYRDMYVVLDGRVNSVTLSKSLYKNINSVSREDLSLHLFKSSDKGLYCFAFREDFQQLQESDTLFTSLQYNKTYNKIGFQTEMLPKLLYEYHLPSDVLAKLSVIPRKTKTGQTFYEIQRPAIKISQ